LSVVESCKGEFQVLRIEHQNLFATDLHLHPVPFFGDPLHAEVITVALNPSFTEFNSGRGWEEQVEAEKLLRQLLTYFQKPPQTWHTWFNQLEKSLLWFGSSYETNAAHVDVFPFPTLWPRRLGEQQKRMLAHLIQLHAGHCRQILKLCHSVKLVIAVDYTFRYQRENFSVFKKFQEIIPNVAHHDGGGIPLLCSSKITGFSEWLFTNRHALRTHLREAKPINFAS